MKDDLKLWEYANKIIPGGNGLLSKRPHRFCPYYWPTYFSKAKEIYIWDLKNKKYTDMSLMGIGTSILGYSNNEVDSSVKRKISQGINTTLNSVEEVKLAEEILKVDTFADKVKFARSGGEAMSIAIRIARAKSNKTKIAFSGYHGWHDWYISANLKNKKNLNNHLLKNVKPLGVPKELKNTTIPIKFNDIKSLISTINKNKLAAIVVEPGRFNLMKKEFVNCLNKISKQKKICLISDEITCGWRSNLGGLYKKIGLKPDIVVYGKALGNGYAISSIVGKNYYLKEANKTFISSTAWTERIGFVSALKVIEILKKKNYSHISKISKIIKNDWLHYSSMHKIKIKVNNYTSIPSFQFNHGNKNEELYTLFTKFFLQKKILATNSLYLSFAHNSRNIAIYRKNLGFVFKSLSNHLMKNKKIKKKSLRKFTY